MAMGVGGGGHGPSEVTGRIGGDRAGSDFVITTLGERRAILRSKKLRGDRTRQQAVYGYLSECGQAIGRAAWTSIATAVSAVVAVCLGKSKAARISVGLLSTTSFDGPLPGDGDLPLPKSVRGAILASERPGIW